MRGFGILLIVMAIGSAVLPHIGYQFVLVMWISTWGPTVAWIIRGAMLVLGVAIVVGAAKRGGGSPVPPQQG